MHPNPAFRSAADAQNLAFAREQSFGLLSLSTKGAPLISHIPFQLSEDGTYAELHLVRSTEITRALTSPAPARLAVQGPHGYISPDWYGVADQVPTWNYVAVHLVGTLTHLPDAALEGVLARLSAQFESRLAPKPVWTMGKMTPEVLAKMMRQIVPFRLDITGVEGTWKLGQNKPDAARIAAAEALESSPTGQETAVLSRLMRQD